MATSASRIPRPRLRFRLRIRRPSLRRVDPVLVVVLAIAAVGSAAWSVVVPPLEGPDEEAHVAYVQRLVDGHDLPQNTTPGAPPSSTELRLLQGWGEFWVVATNPPTKPAATEVERRAFDRDVRDAGPGARSDGLGYGAAASYPPLYYLYAAVPYAAGTGATLPTRLELVRLAGIPLLLVVVAATWLLCAELLPRPYWARTLAAGAVALQPVLSFIAGVVNPDIMLAAIWSVFMLVAVRAVKHGPTARRILLLGGLAAASALTQPRGLTIALPAAFAVLLAAWTHRLAIRDLLRRALPATALALVGIAGYWFVVSVYGGAETAGQINAVTQRSGFNLREFVSYVWQFYQVKLRFMEPMIGPPRGFRYVWVESFFGVFGQLDTHFPAWVYDRLHSWSLYALAGFAVCVAVRWDALRRHWREGSVLLVTGLTLLATLHLAAYQSLKANNATDPILVGRYLFPCIALFGLAIAFTATTLPRRFGIALGIVVLGAGVLLQIGGLGAAIGRWHA